MDWKGNSSGTTDWGNGTFLRQGRYSTHRVNAFGTRSGHPVFALCYGSMGIQQAVPWKDPHQHDRIRRTPKLSISRCTNRV